MSNEKKEWRTDLGSVEEGAMRVLILHVYLQPFIIWLGIRLIPAPELPDGEIEMTYFPRAFSVMVLAVGITQFLYLIPAFALLSTRRSDIFLGMLIAAGLTLLITSTCATLTIFSWSTP